jgi:RimJ/RimL family protein N-acetyltransferase
VGSCATSALEVLAERIATARLRLDPLCQADATDMVEVLADPRLYEFTGGEPPADEATLRERYDDLAAGSGLPDEHWLNWIVRLPDPDPVGGGVDRVGGGVDRVGGDPDRVGGGVDRVGGGVDRVGGDPDRVGGGPDARAGVAVGTVQATVTPDVAWVAWVIGAPWQGRGIASEAAVALIGWLRSRGVTAIAAAIHPGHPASAGVAVRAGLTRTDETIDGEQVWRG